MPRADGLRFFGPGLLGPTLLIVPRVLILGLGLALLVLSRPLGLGFIRRVVITQDGGCHYISWGSLVPFRFLLQHRQEIATSYMLGCLCIVNQIFQAKFSFLIN